MTFAPGLVMGRDHHAHPVDRRLRVRRHATCRGLPGPESRPPWRRCPRYTEDALVGKFMRKSAILHRRLQRLRQFDQQLEPSGVRAARPATITGILRRHQHLGRFGDRAESPAGGDDSVNFGIRRLRVGLGMGSSCNTASATITTGSIGGVIAILYARTADSANCCSDTGESSHLV